MRMRDTLRKENTRVRRVYRALVAGERVVPEAMDFTVATGGWEAPRKKRGFLLMWMMFAS